MSQAMSSHVHIRFAELQADILAPYENKKSLLL